MKKILIITGIAVSCLCSCATTSTRSNDKSNQLAQEVRENLIIFYDSTIGDKPLLKEIESYKAEIIYQYKSLNGLAIKLPKGKNIEKAIKHFQQVEGVLQVSKDEVMQLQ
ncbi:hypothetical protein [Bacteroides reticulotermitis]|uniref:hypothetical protein n=1 Tax=Bacteroides reticulotermitis TaxID=1133319 RepID=UPI001D8FB1DF|nr:hypothetical protein [Bacteroides reticulotermitis]